MSVVNAEKLVSVFATSSVAVIRNLQISLKHQMVLFYVSALWLVAVYLQCQKLFNFLKLIHWQKSEKCVKPLSASTASAWVPWREFMFSALFYSDQSRSLFWEVLFGSLFWETDLY